MRDGTKAKASWRIRIARIVLGATVTMPMLMLEMHAQNTPIVARRPASAPVPAHLPTDWSHGHLIFSAPNTLAQQVRLMSNARYMQQLARRNPASSARPDAWRWNRAPENPKALRGDWNAYLGIDGSTGNAAVMGVDVYPAKFSFDASSQNCAADFVAFPTGLVGSATAIAAQTFGIFSATNDPSPGQTITITNGASSETVTSSDSGNTGGNWQIASGDVATDASNLADAINRQPTNAAVGVTATANSPALGYILVAANTPGLADNAITLTNTDANIQFPPGNNLLDGGTGQPSIVAYNNLYGVPCTGSAGPSVYWAYNTGNAEAVATSPVLSGDGTQLAFVQNNGSTAALVILKWSATDGSNIENPLQPTAESAGSYRGCAAPCMATLTFSATNGDTAALDATSSPFYDYTPGDDTLYVGDDNGYLHKFTGVFSGAPGETTTAQWPVNVTSVNGAQNILTSPVYDESAGAHGRIFVADSGGFLYAIDAGTGSVATSANFGAVSIVESPTVDSTRGTVYVYAANVGVVLISSAAPANPQLDIQPEGASFCLGAPTVVGFSANFTAGQGAASSAVVGADGACPPLLYAGAFDQSYLSGAGGNMYICSAGRVSGGFFINVAPQLYQIAVDGAGTLGAVTAGPMLATSDSEKCSAVTEFYNNPGGGVTPHDWIYTSVPASGLSGDGVIDCPPGNSGCIMAFDVTSGAAISTSTPTIATAAARGGTSGIIVDNDTSSGGSQVYFTPISSLATQCTTVGNVGVGGCAIQASQSGLN